MTNFDLWATLINSIAPMVVALLGIIPTIISNRKVTVTKIAEVEKKLDKHIAEDMEEHAKVCRQRVIRFATEVRKGGEFDSDAWNAISIDCQFYLDYCKKHPNFPDGICKTTIQFLTEHMAKLVAEGALV